MSQEPDFTAMLDQAGAHMAGIARLLGEFRYALEMEGFERAESQELVVEYELHLLSLAVRSEDD